MREQSIENREQQPTNRDGIPFTEHHSRRESPGFTLVEMIVAIALFAIVMLVAVGALLALTAANQKAQALQSVMNNLNISLDSMVRNMRMGTDFDSSASAAGDGTITCLGDGPGPHDCSGVKGANGISFTCNSAIAGCTAGARWAYRFVCPPPGLAPDGTCSTGGYIARSVDGSNANPPWQQITSTDVAITSMTFYTVGTLPGDATEPKAIVVLVGTAGGGSARTKTTFHIEATAVQRELDL